MDAKLAAFYGTNAPDEADVEKLAAAELAEKLAGEESVNLEGMSDEQLEAVAQEILDEGAQGEEAEEEKAEVTEPEDDAQEKIAEADYLGRVMAHAYVQELKGIDKEAAKMEGPSKLRFKMHQAGGAAKGMAGKVGKHLAGHKGKYMGGAAAAAAAGGAAHHFMKKHKEKKSSAVDTLVEARIAEILEASDIDPASLKKVEQEKTSGADPKEVLAQTVEQRAWETLAQYGVTPAEE